MIRSKNERTLQNLSGIQVPVVRYHTTVVVHSASHKNPRFSLDVLILPCITRSIPSRRIRIISWSHLEGLTLADLHLFEPLYVDLIHGDNIFPYFILGEKKESTMKQPIALSTDFAWVLTRKTSSPTTL